MDSEVTASTKLDRLALNNPSLVARPMPDKANSPAGPKAGGQSHAAPLGTLKRVASPVSKIALMKTKSLSPRAPEAAQSHDLPDVDLHSDGR